MVMRPRIYPTAAIAKTDSIRKLAAFIENDMTYFLLNLSNSYFARVGSSLRA